MLNDQSNHNSLPKYLAKLLMFAIIYFIAARLGLLLATINQSISPVWPASGFALGILFLAGEEFWPAIALGAFLANYLTSAPLFAIFFITIGNTLHAVIGIRVLKYFNIKNIELGSHTRTLGIIAASIFGAMISASVGSLALRIFSQTTLAPFQTMWITWFTGDALGGITFLPLLLSFSKKNSSDFKNKNPHFFTAIPLLVTGIFLCWLLFIRPGGSPYLFFIFPYLFLCAASGGERGVALSTILISLFGVCSVKMGYGVFNTGSTNSNLINLQLFLASVGISSLMMTDLKRSSSLKQPALILFFSWLLAGLFFFGFYVKSIKQSDKHFQEIIDGVSPLLDAKINLYFSALQSGTGLFAASTNVERNEWKAFLEHSQFEKQLSALDGMGVIFRVRKKNLSKFIETTQADGAADFSYHLLPGLTATELAKAKSQEEAYLVTYFEPSEKNKLTLGLDMSSEEEYKASADLARDTGEPTILPKVLLIDNPKNQASILIFYPFYTKGIPPKDINERRARLQGWIYAPIFASSFFNSVFSLGNFKGLSYSVSENDESPISVSPDFEKLLDHHGQLRDIKVGNRTLHFYFKRSKEFYSDRDAFASWAGGAASIISLLIGAFIVSLQRVKKNALALAKKRTVDLKASEELWKFALEGAGDGVWDWNVETGKVFYSENYAKILGYEEKELKSHVSEWEHRLHPDDYQRVMSELESHFKSNTNYVTEHRMLCKDGQYKWVLARGMVVAHNAEGKPQRMVGTMSDISTWKEAEHEIDRQRSKFHSIFEGSSDALIIVSMEGFIDCNSRTLELFGIENKDDFISMTPYELSAPVQPDGMDSKIKANIQIQKAFKRGVNRFEWMLKRRNGEIFPAEILLTAFTYDDKRVLQACIRDISERKQIESAFISQREKLMTAAKMSSLGEMAGGIAHEINNPLAIIIGKTTQLKRRMKEQGESPLKQYNDDLAIIENTAKRISAIIKGLNAFSRNAENDKMEKVLITVLINDTIELSKERFRFQSIDLNFDLESSEKTYVMGRASQLLQVLINLLNNAYDAVENLPEKWVEIKVSSSQNICTISITDSGPGIPPHILEKIMTPFFTTKEVGRGTGLGLSISKGIIEEHQGKLYYDTSSTHTRFIIELPIA